LVWGLGSIPLHAQSIVSGSLAGTVQRTDGGTVSQALLTLRALDRGIIRQTVADGSGRFSFGMVEPGFYELRAEALGFRPVVASPLQVTAGNATRFAVDMHPAPPPVETVDTVVLPSRAQGSWSRGGTRAGPARIAEIPDAFGDLGTLAALSSRSDEFLGSEGLPGELTLLVADGVPFYRATHPAMRGEALSTAIFSPMAVSNLEVLSTPADIEWAGSAGTHLALTGRSAVGPGGTVLGGWWSGDPLWSSSKLDFQAPSMMSVWGAGSAALEIKPDTSGVFLAGEALQLESPLAPRFSPGAASPLTGLDPAVALTLTQPAVERTRRASGLASLDWALGTARRLTMRATVGRLERQYVGFGPATLEYGGASPETATDFSVVGGMVTAYGPRMALELRGGVTGSNHTYNLPLEAGAVPSTMLVGSGLPLGNLSAADVSRLDFHLSPVFLYEHPQATFKGGLTIRASHDKLEYGRWEGGQYYFGDAAAAAAGSGVLVESSAAPSSSFGTWEIGGFAQYSFDLAPGLRFSLGGRYDYEALPSSKISRNNAWVTVSGIMNDSTVTALKSQSSAVASLSWDVTGDGSTEMDGVFSVTHGNMDPALLHEVYSHDGAVDVSRYAGSSLEWPGGGIPDGATRTPTLTLLGPDSRAPVSTRASVGLIHRGEGGWGFYAGGTVRRSDFLPRRRDLNLPIFPYATDEHGRAILGDLRNLGGVVVPDPGSNRRFSGFDDVWAIDTDGWSTYKGVTVGVEHRGPSLDVFASYTHSGTRDNWVGAAAGVPEAQLPPGLPVVGDWTEGTSDFDVPDRLVAGLTLGVGPERAVAATGIVRYESGLPFTPGYRPGVDINGDGSPLNDVAWVPAGGDISGLLSEWPCLADQGDSFATRNSCRGPARTGLDVQVRARLTHLGSRTLEVVVDAFGLIESEQGLRDAALLLVDPSASITTTPDGTVTVPVRVNPDFGKVIVPTGRGRMLRVGLRIGGAS